MANLIELKNLQNNLFFAPGKIFNRLARSYKVKIQEYNLGDIIDWCAELEQEILVDVEALIKFSDLQIGFPSESDPSVLVIENSMVPLPPFIHRITMIYDENDNIIQGAGSNGSYIFLPSDFTGSKVFIAGRMIAFDSETMTPLLLRGHEQAAFAFCVYKMFEEDIDLQKVSQNVGLAIKQRMEQAMAESSGSLLALLTSDDYVRYCNIMMDLVPDMKGIFKNN